MFPIDLLWIMSIIIAEPERKVVESSSNAEQQRELPVVWGQDDDVFRQNISLREEIFYSSKNKSSLSFIAVF
jgi:hypothetical protein